MERIDLERIADAILTAPSWVRVGITARVQTLRREAALELALDISVAMDAPPPLNDDQPELAL